MTDLLPRFGRYDTIEVIGAGAIGVVYRAHDPLIDRPVAIKMIRTELLDEAERADYRERFRIEGRAFGRCAHSAIVAIYDVGEDEDCPYLVMEFVEGHTLQAVLAEQQRRAELDVIVMMEDVLAAIGVAHEKGIVHRDIKPANIIITRDGRAKVMDFGIARLDRGEKTQIGDMLGTPSYMAPEQVNGTAVDHRADLFSAACVLHSVLVGRPPFAGTTVSATLMRLIGPEAADLTPLAAGPFAHFVPVLRRALAKDPSLRFSSAVEFAEAIRTACTRTDDHTIIAASPKISASLVSREQGIGVVDPAVVAQAAERLTRHIGPIARVLAVRAAREASDVASFIALLARHIPQAQTAQQFLRETGTLDRTGHGVAMAAGAGPKTTTGTGTGMLPGLAPHALEAARAALALEVGPIAGVLIAKALRKAATPDELIALIVGEAPNSVVAQTWQHLLQTALGGEHG